MTIRIEKGSSWVILRDKKTVVSSKFSHITQPLADDPKFTVEILVESSDGARPKCHGLKVSSPNQEVTWKTMRSLPVDTLVREAVERFVVSLPMHVAGRTENGGFRFEEGPPSVDAARQFTTRSRDRQTQTDEHLTEVARIYKEAVERGERAPTEEVARQMLGSPWKQPTAKRWVSNARKAGYLPKTKPGKKAA